MSRRLTTQECVERCVKAQGETYDYSRVAYVDAVTPIEIVCRLHGSFWMNMHNHLYGEGCRPCSIARRALNRTYTLETFIQKALMVHGSRYDYTPTVYRRSTEPVEILCQKHGSFWVRPADHLQGVGCWQCGVDRQIAARAMTKEEFLVKAGQVHADRRYDYVRVNYVNSKTPVEIVCPDHGSFWQIPNDHLSGHGCPNCQASFVEEGVADWLRASGLSFIRHDREVLKGLGPNGGSLELDIHIPEHRVAVEVNGVLWHSEKFSTDRQRHIRKTKLCLEKGITLIQPFCDELKVRPHLVRGLILGLCGQRVAQRVGARKCEVQGVSTSDAKGFLEHHHLQGSVRSPVRLGLVYDGKLLVLATFGRPRTIYGGRHDHGDVWELHRLCTHHEYNVPGGFSRLLGDFERRYPGAILRTYVDRRWSQGQVYQKAGFQLVGESEPGYWWVKSGKRYHRYKFAKHNLPKLLPDFNPSLTEVENMERNGYYRVWDCGTLRFEKTMAA